MFFAVTFLSFFALSTENNVTQSEVWNDDILDISSSFHETQNTCEGLLTCVCSMDGSYVLITCKGLKSIDKLLHLLKSKYEHSTISHIYISKSTIDHLPPRAFQNLSIQKIFIRRSLVKNVSDDAFLGIAGLIELRLDNFHLTKIPSSIGKLNNTLRALWMENGDLESIQRILQNSSQMQMLSLRINKITEIDPSAFLHMTNLNKLNLSNNTIKWIDPKTFSSLEQLRYLNLMGNNLQNTSGLFDNHQFSIQLLDLGSNNISDIANLTRNTLYSLNTLDLQDNPLRVIKNNSFEKCPALLHLYLSSTQLTIIEPDAFKPMTRLLKVDIAHNLLSHLDKDTFANMEALQFIELSDNRFETIDAFFQHIPQIREIYASENRLSIIDPHCFENAKYLQRLYLSRNSLHHIDKDTFINNGQLQQLQLMRNRIKYLDPDSFHGLYSLQFLSISHNLLETLNGSINNLPNLRILDLNHNHLTILEANSFLNVPNLQIVNVGTNLLRSVEGAFVHLTNMHTLRLQDNRLETITKSSLPFPTNLKFVDIVGNPLTCNCLLKWLVELITNKRVTVDKARCKQPEWLERKPLKQLSLNDVTQWPEDCPQDCICTCFPNSTDYYIRVYCAGLQLTKAPNILPNKTGYLDLSRNQIDSMHQLTLDNLTQLQYLFLHENNLTSIPDLSAVELRILTLANNHLTRFPVSKVDSTFLEHANLSNNRWLCDCQTLIFRKWLLTEDMVVSDVNSTKCDDVEVNGNLRNKLIVSLTEALLCPSFIAFYASIIVAILGFLLFVAGGKIAYNRYRMNIKIWMYSKGICSCLSCVKEEDLDEDKQFDAFVSYSSADERFVVRNLVPMLESGEKPYHLCLHYRHFAPGSYVQDSIIQAVQLSKRIILVLSQNFLKSEWCRLEFKSAHHLVLEERLNRLIVIILGEMPPKDDIDPEIKLYLETTTYLVWGEKNFWNKLNYVMPRTPCVVTEEDRMRLLD